MRLPAFKERVLFLICAILIATVVYLMFSGINQNVVQYKNVHKNIVVKHEKPKEFLTNNFSKIESTIKPQMIVLHNRTTLPSLMKTPKPVLKLEASTDTLLSTLIDFLNMDVFEARAPNDDLNHNVILMGEDDDTIPKKGKRRKRKPISLYDGLPILEKFYTRITRYSLYSEEDDVFVDEFLKSMANETIKYVEQKSGGTQIKLTVDMQNGIKALLKPKRQNQEISPNLYYFSDYERHNAEIAAFHLDRLLEFRRAMPVTGRIVNLNTEIIPNADSALVRTMFLSPTKSMCFTGRCKLFCEMTTPICGNPHELEVSLAAYLPPDDVLERHLWRHPWRRTYNYKKKATWETEDRYCELVKRIEPYNTGRRLYDIIDMAVYDFLIGNMDRHHYETFSKYGNNTFILHIDQGRGFGHAFRDELSILAPLTQCCIIRESTVQTLLKFYKNPQHLSDAMRESLNKDPLSPVLSEAHLKALDRRLLIVLQEVQKCLTTKNTLTEEEQEYEASRMLVEIARKTHIARGAGDGVILNKDFITRVRELEN